MNFTLDESQRAIADLATNVFSDYCSDSQLARHWSQAAGYDLALWQQLQETGLNALVVPEAQGGSGLGMMELMLVLEQQGRFIAPVPLWNHQLATAALSLFADAQTVDRWVPGLVQGKQLATLSLDGLVSSRGLKLTARPDATGWLLNGRVEALAWGGQAQLALLPVRIGEEVRLAWVDLSLPGIAKLDGVLTHHEPAADLCLTDVALEAGAVLDEGALPWLSSRAVACLGALQLGVAREALARAVTYTSERVQFGRPIGSFQAITQRAADGLMDIEALRSCLWQLCWRIDAGVDATGAAGAVKTWACDCGHRVSHTVQHVHGGMGVDLSYPIHRFTLWSRALELSFGGVSAQMANLGRWLSQCDLAAVAP